MSVAGLARPIVATRRGAVAVVWVLGAFVCGAATPDAAAESAEGAPSAEAAPEAVEDASSSEAAEASPAEESADEPAGEESAADGPAEVFVPSENISEDISVPFPVDI